MSIAGGYYKAVEAAAGFGMDTVQIFTKNNNQWRAKPLTDDDVREFQAALERTGIQRPSAHDSYLINLASPDDGLWEKSLEAFVVELERAEVVTRGREIRHHQAFAPAGTNVNFITCLETGLIAIRTYERGVEDETLACGTGSIAAALVTSEKTGWASPVRVKTRSGIELKIHFTRQPDGYREVHLEGDARVVYQGELWEDAYR